MLGGGGGDAEQHKATAQGQGGELGRLERSELLVSPSPRAPPIILARPVLGCIAWSVSECCC